MRLQHFFDRGPQSQIGETDYSRRNPRVTVLPAGALRSDAVDEFGLTHRSQRFGAVRPIHRETFDKDGRDYPMPGSGIAQDLVEQVAVVRMIPQVMMRIDDRQLRRDRLFDDLSQPCFR